MPRRSLLPVGATLGLVVIAACAGTVNDSTASGSHDGTGSGGAGSGGATGGSGGAQPWPDGGGGTAGAVPDAGGGLASDASGAGAGGASGGASGAGGTGGAGGSGAGGSCSAEVCNNLDDNCNGQIDENLTRSCSSACGAGTETCSAGQWGACSAPQPISCMNYSTCAKEPQCVTSCPGAPAESCDLRDDDCNGSCDDGAGCRAGVYRSYKSATGEHFYSRSPSEAACCGFSVEYADYFYVYASATADLVALYRCVASNGMHFLTTSSSCEGAPGSTNEGPLGYVAPSAECGAVPLYRLSASSGDHFYTISSSERQSTIGAGYTDEGTVGYVWKAP